MGTKPIRKPIFQHNKLISKKIHTNTTRQLIIPDKIHSKINIYIY